MENVRGSIFGYWQQFVAFAKDVLTPQLHPHTFKNPQLVLHVKKRSLIFASLTINLLSLALPIMSLQIYDRILVYKNLGTLRLMAFGICLAVIFEGILRLCRAYLFNWSGAVFEHAISCNMIRQFLTAELKAIENRNIGEHLQSFTAANRLREFFSGQILLTLIDLPFVAVYLFFIFYLAGWLVFIPLLLLIAFAFVAWHESSRLKETLQKRDVKDEERFDLTIETLSGIHTVKAFGLENLFERRYENIMSGSGEVNYRVSKEHNNSNNYGSLFTQLMTASIVCLGAFLAYKGSITLGVLIACVLLAGRIMQPVQNALSLRTRYQECQIAVEKVNKTFEMPSFDKFDENDVITNEGMLELKNLCFSFEGTKPYLIEGLNLKVKRGQAVSLSGEYGCGRSTLLKVITGLYRPSEGEVLINGFSSTLFHSSELARSVGYLPTEGVIFSGTIRENITAFGEVPEEKAMDVARLLGVESEIQLLPNGYETKITGGMADVISPGLKQRIAIARALAYKPRLILFDNADRALDKEGYNQVFRLLGRLRSRVAMIIVSDDRNFIGLAEKHYILKKGELIENKDLRDSHNFDVNFYQELKI